MQVDRDVLQAGVLQPFQHHLERGPLFRDEQNAAPGRGQAPDQVGDGLALARSRRPVNDGALAGQHGPNSPLLARVGVQNQKLVLRRIAI